MSKFIQSEVLSSNSININPAIVAKSDNVAIVKNVVIDGNELWQVILTSGKEVAITNNRDFAFILAKQNNLSPQSLH